MANSEVVTFFCTNNQVFSFVLHYFFRSFRHGIHQFRYEATFDSVRHRILHFGLQRPMWRKLVGFFFKTENKFSITFKSGPLGGEEGR